MRPEKVWFSKAHCKEKTLFKRSPYFSISALHSMQLYKNMKIRHCSKYNIYELHLMSIHIHTTIFKHVTVQEKPKSLYLLIFETKVGVALA